MAASPLCQWRVCVRPIHPFSPSAHACCLSMPFQVGFGRLGMDEQTRQKTRFAPRLHPTHIAGCPFPLPSHAHCSSHCPLDSVGLVWICFFTGGDGLGEIGFYLFSSCYALTFFSLLFLSFSFLLLLLSLSLSIYLSTFSSLSFSLPSPLFLYICIYSIPIYYHTALLHFFFFSKLSLLLLYSFP